MKTEEAKKKIEGANLNWEDFLAWMFGQTFGLIDGEPDWYEWDLDRFIRINSIRRGSKSKTDG